MRGDAEECLLLLRRYYHRTAKACRRSHATLSHAAPSLAAPRTPLFVYMAWQEAHVPNEVPAFFTTKSIDYPLRRAYEGMVHCLDSGISNVSRALRRKGMCCLLYTSPSPRDAHESRMPSSA